MNYSLETLQEKLYTAVISDALDSVGYPHQSPRPSFEAYTGITRLAGRCKTTLWVDMYHEDPDPYALELQGGRFVSARRCADRGGFWFGAFWYLGRTAFYGGP